ncbi:ciliated left-right organizer metallopeptidase [Osmerus mordax]|uniref:ciliated left-right organizer metallopeptidase n=1 Tax=Osmerus mordax TaxID=8014 RepID=UPI00350FFD7C
MVVVWAPGALGKCIFDEVQSSVSVVTTTPTHQEKLRHKTILTNSSISSQLHIHSNRSKDPTQPSSSRSAQLALSPTAQSGQRETRKMRELAPPRDPTRQPIRIQTWVPRESPVLSQAERERLDSAVREAVLIVSSLLSVDRIPGGLWLSRDINKYCRFTWRNTSAANYNRCGRANKNYRMETCLDVVIPDDHLSGCAVYPEPNSPTKTVLRPEGAGLPDTDFLLYVHTQSTDKCRAEPSVLAYAVHCQTGPLGRPLAGVMVICRDRLTGHSYSHQGTVQTVIHELFHGLGFSKQLFSSWTDCSSPPCSPRGQVTYADGTGQVRIYTHSIIRALQKHLRSTDPELGGPLENQDAGPGGLSSHWESRVLQGSIMASSLGDSTVVRVDPVTLAALQDTGWYSANLSRAQSLVWGQGEGAMFGSLSTCHDNSSSFFCSGSGLGCHYLHFHKGECQTDQYLDGCRVYKPLTNGSECWIEENERVTGEEDWAGEVYRSDSRCFFSNLSRENTSLPVGDSTVGRCYRHRCTGLNTFQVQVSGAGWMDCPAGGASKIPGYQGLVFCPEGRLCQYSDHIPVATADPSSDRVSNGRGTEPTVSVVLGVTAALSLLAAVMAAYRKYRSSRVRVHAALQAPSAVQLHSAQSLSKHC